MSSSYPARRTRNRLQGVSNGSPAIGRIKKEPHTTRTTTLIKLEQSPPSTKTKIKVMSEKYLVEKIVEKKIEKGRPFYLIKWKNYPSNSNTWEPKEHLSPILVENYETTLVSNPPSPAKRTREPPTSESPAKRQRTSQDHVSSTSSSLTPKKTTTVVKVDKKTNIPTPGPEAVHQTSETNIHTYNSTQTSVTHHPAHDSKAAISMTFEIKATVIQEKDVMARIIHVGLHLCDDYLKNANWASKIRLLEISGPIYSCANLRNLITFFKHAKELRFNITSPNPELQEDPGSLTGELPHGVTMLRVKSCSKVFKAQSAKDQKVLVSLLRFIFRLAENFKKVTAVKLEVPGDPEHHVYRAVCDFIKSVEGLANAEVRTNVIHSKSKPEKNCGGGRNPGKHGEVYCIYSSVPDSSPSASIEATWSPQENLATRSGVRSRSENNQSGSLGPSNHKLNSSAPVKRGKQPRRTNSSL